LIAEMYKKAIEVGGYNFVNKGVSNLVNMLDDEDDEEQMAVEDLLNKVSKDLRARAKATPLGDTDTALEALKKVKNDFNTRLISEDMEQSGSLFEEGLEHGEVGGDFDQTGGVSQEVGATKGRGYRVERRSYKDWAQSYEDERQRFEHELTVPELQLSRTGLEARRNTATRSNLHELVNLLGYMSTLTREAIQLENDLQAAPDPTKQARLEEIRQELKDDQNRRLSLKKSLRNYQFTQQNKSLQEEVKAARPEDKLLIELRMKLNDLMMSPDRGKDVEAKWLRAWINSISGGHSIPPEQVERVKQRIQEGAARKTKATFMWRQRAEQVAGIKGIKGPVRERQVGQHGEFGKRNQYNLNILPLDGLIVHLTQRLATERIVVKQKVTDKMKKAQQDPAILKPFMDDVAKAATKKDKSDLLAAAQRLKAKMTEYKNIQPEVVQYVISLRSSKFMYSFRDRAKQVGEWIGKPLEPEQASFIDDTIREGHKLISFYKNLKVKHPILGGPPGSTHYNPPTEIIEKIVKSLEGAKYG
jgi:hypothetical protein